MTEFAAPMAFWLLPVALVPIWLAYRHSRRRPGVRYAALRDIERAGVNWRVRAVRALPVVRALALALLVVALARPRVANERGERTVDAVAMQIVLDRSSSMQEGISYEGRAMRRFEAVKLALREFLLGSSNGELDGRPDDLIGLVSFAGFPTMVCPMVGDPEVVVRFADDIAMARYRDEDGTAIGDAVALAAARLKRQEELRERWNENDEEGRDPDGRRIASKAIILLTDGSNNAGERDPLEAADLAAQWGVRIYAIGLGSTNPMRDIDTGLGRMRMPGRLALDEAMLNEIAQRTGGLYKRAETGADLLEIYRQIDELETSEVIASSVVTYSERFGRWVKVAAALLALEWVLGLTVLRRAP